jgi:hypothetical protein
LTVACAALTLTASDHPTGMSMFAIVSAGDHGDRAARRLHRHHCSRITFSTCAPSWARGRNAVVGLRESRLRAAACRLEIDAPPTGCPSS